MNFWTPWSRKKPQIIVAVTKRKEVDTSITSDAHKQLMSELHGAKVPYCLTAKEKGYVPKRRSV